MTAFIVDEVIRRINCSAIVAEQSRDIVDLNRLPRVSDPISMMAMSEYWQRVNDILKYLGIVRGLILDRPYLQVSVHGMQDQQNIDINICTRNGRLAKPDVIEYIVETLRVGGGFRVGVDEVFRGSEVLEHLRYGNQIPKFKGVTGYGDGYNIVAIEIASWLRNVQTLKFRKLIESLADVITGFNEKFVQ